MTHNNIKISIANNAHREVIYRMRHHVYARELKQHPENALEILKDDLDEFNTYIVACINNQVAGFISITPPKNDKYSIDKYLGRDLFPFQADEGLYEMRILTVVEEHRNKALAILLIIAAFRWIESHGGTHIMAIGKVDILDMYLKLGFNSTGRRIQSGSVEFELIFGWIDELNDHINQNLKDLFDKLSEKCVWDLGVPFFKPVECYHGGAFFDAIGAEFDQLNRRKGIINADVLDAWFPPSPKVIKELQDHLRWLCRTSPPTNCEGMVESIARVRGVKKKNILVGAGSSDLIFLAFREWLNKSSRVLILDPSYGEYAHILEKVIGCQVDRLILSKTNDYKLDLDEFIAYSKRNYEMEVLVNPNSPTGQYIQKSDLIKVLKYFPKSTKIWVDETYIEYIGNDSSLERFAVETENIIICKSMSKVYALSGLRAAYLCAAYHQLETLKSITPPWAVSLPGQLAAVFALQDPGYYEKYYKMTHQLREELIRELSDLNIMRIIPGTANFILFELAPEGPVALDLVEKCREKGLFLRDVSNMGTQFGDRTIRIAVKDRESNLRMVSIIKEVLFE